MITVYRTWHICSCNNAILAITVESRFDIGGIGKKEDQNTKTDLIICYNTVLVESVSKDIYSMKRLANAVMDIRYTP